MNEPLDPVAPSEERIRRITVEVAGSDPLVARYVDQRRTHCAYRIFSWWWILLSLVVLPVCGWYAARYLTLPDWAVGTWLERWNQLSPPLFNLELVPWLALVHPVICHATMLWAGVLGGALGLAMIGRYLKPGGVPATQEPWWVALPLILLHLAVVDRLVALTVLIFLICAIYLLAIGFRLGALLAPRHRPFTWLAWGAYGLVFLGVWLRIDQGSDPWFIAGIGLPAVWVTVLVIRRCFPRRPSLPAGADPDPWPMYTVLVPLYRERAVADKIVRHLDALDYPRDRLDVKFLLEADDPATLAALREGGIPAWAEVIIVPDAQPKTKPRACNYGLKDARGEYLVIYDAEDRPEPDQLKRSVREFRRHPGRVACLQAQLAYHNHDQNLLTRWFALEYNVWFQRYLPGLTALGGPIPLGGTSNHFKTGVLHELGGWDPFNVTEDCDLGVRLHVAGHRTETFDSITWEEANSRPGNWLRQRSRWLKGYLITHIVWSRRPLHLFWRLGPAGCLRFLYSIFGVAGLALLNLVLWAIMAVYAVLISVDLYRGFGFVELIWSRVESRMIQDNRLSWPLVFWGGEDLDPDWSRLSVIFFVVSVSLLAANVVFALINTLYGRRPGQRGLILAGLISPLYWVLISLGAWKGFIQMLFRPHYWEKTIHNLDASYQRKKLGL